MSNSDTTNKLIDLGISLGIVLTLYMAMAFMVFSFRHPWATKFEKFIHIVDVMSLSKVPYAEMRGRD